MRTGEISHAPNWERLESRVQAAVIIVSTLRGVALLTFWNQMYIFTSRKHMLSIAHDVDTLLIEVLLCDFWIFSYILKDFHPQADKRLGKTMLILLFTVHQFNILSHY